MSCAADRGVIASKTIPDITKFSQANNGIRLSFIPGQRIEIIVAMILMAVPILPKPEANRAIVQ